MPLTRGRILGYDNERIALRFTMLNDGKEVAFQISAGAMRTPPDREAQFLRAREAIESIASAKFRSGTTVQGGVVRIFAKDLRKHGLPVDAALEQREGA
jgi:hypothetical protein